MIKAAFFDIDGTLVSFKTHAMPRSTVAALEALRARGVRVILASGRPTYQLQPFLREGFDAYITLNGQLCLDARGVFRSHPLDDADVRAIVAQARAGRYAVLALQRDRAFLSERTPRAAQVEHDVDIVYPLDDIDRALDAPVYQFCAFLPREQEGQILAATSHVALTRWTDLFCDVVPDEGGKAYGVRAALERYGIGPEEAVAFGDGENDLSMFSAVGTSVAMGNAWDEVKRRATLVTDSVDDDGVWNACRRLGLVEGEPPAAVAEK